MQAYGILLILVHFSRSTAASCNANNYSGSSWYLSLIYCSYQSGSTGLLACLSTTSWGTGIIPAIGPGLIAEVGGNTPCALNCITPLVNALNVGLTTGSIKSKCGAVWSAASVATFNSQACMAALYALLNKFNACAANGADLRTGLPTTRCIYDDFIGILRDFTPYIYMIDLAAAQVAKMNYRSHVAPGFSSRLDSFPCGTCFDSLYDSLLALSAQISTTCQGDDKFNSPCSTVLLGQALANFGVCAGGFSMYTLKPSYCSAEQQSLSADLFRPYRSGVECVYLLLQYPTYNPTYDCVGLYNGLVDSPQVPCTTCMIAALGNILFQMQPYCRTFGAYSPLCINSYTGINGMLAQFQLCAGFKLNTNDPSCSGFEWDQILSLDAGYFAPLFWAGISSNSFNDAARVIDTDISFTNTSLAISNVSCSNCFKAFAADSWFLWSKNATTRSACAPNVFSDDCFFDAGVTKIRGRFKACSGQDLLPETYNRCTTDEVKNMADKAGEIFKIGISSTSIDPVKEYIVSSVIDSGMVSRSCGVCYMYYGTELFRLDDATKSACDSYYSCTLVTTGNMTQIRQGFYTCAGEELVVSPESSVIEMATPPPYSVASFVPLYTGNATNTKSHQIQPKYAFSLLIACILLLIVC